LLVFECPIQEKACNEEDTMTRIRSDYKRESEGNMDHRPYLRAPNPWDAHPFAPELQESREDGSEESERVIIIDI